MASIFSTLDRWSFYVIVEMSNYHYLIARAILKLASDIKKSVAILKFHAYWPGKIFDTKKQKTNSLDIALSEHANQNFLVSTIVLQSLGRQEIREKIKKIQMHTHREKFFSWMQKIFKHAWMSYLRNSSQSLSKTIVIWKWALVSRKKC